MSNLFKSKDVNLANVYQQFNQQPSKKSLSQKRRSQKIIFRFLRYFSIGIIAIFSVLLIVALLNFVNLRYIYVNIISGKSNLEQAAELIKTKEYEDSLKKSTLAEKNFSEALKTLEEYQDNFFINHISFVSDNYDNAFYLLSVAQILSNSVVNATRYGINANEILGGHGLDDLSEDKRREILKYIYEGIPELNGVKANINLAITYLDHIKFSGLFFIIKDEGENLKTQLNKTKLVLEEAIPMSQLLPLFFGYPDKTSFLVLLQNKDELRPTGGFIGTYGIVEVSNGEILRFDTHDIYHMDMPVKDKINVIPPEPLKKYLGVDKWFMRDSNWSPDWPSSANKIEEFYKMEDKLLPPKDQINNFTGEFDAVIGITPDLIIDLIKLVGPIDIDGERYDENNFLDILQYKVEKGYVQLGVPSWQRKEVVGEISKELKNRIFDLKIVQFYDFFSLLKENLAKKNVLVYCHDDQFQDIVKNQKWAGEVKNPIGDYFMVVDSNMASLKTDKFIDRSIEYKIKQGNEGVFSDLRINYSHSGTFDWRTTRYRTYTRVYAPLGSKLIESSGFMEGVAVYEELGKTVFAGFLSVEPGEIANIRLYYQLPKNINDMIDSGFYKLYAQKQPGTDISQFLVDLNFINNVELYNPTGFYSYKNDKSIKWETDLKTDKEFLVELKR